eukprot:Ihof_evm3s204 gene=Ihof_evmTU3s204
MVTKALRNIASICGVPAHANSLVASDVIPKLVSYIEGTGFAIDKVHEEDMRDMVLVILSQLVTNQDLASTVIEQIDWKRISNWFDSDNAGIRQCGVRIITSALHASIEKNNDDNAVEPPKIEEVDGEEEDKSNRAKFLQHRLLDFIVEKLNKAARFGGAQSYQVIDDVIVAVLGNVSPVLLSSFIGRQGITALLNCAGCSGELGSIEDNNMKLCIAVALSKLAAIANEDQTETLNQICVKYVRNGLLSGHDQDELRALNALSCVLQANNKMGGWLVEQEGISKLLVECCDSNSVAVQCAVTEVVSLAASDRARCAMIVSEGAAQLSRLYMSENDQVAVRALVGLSKIATVSQSKKDHDIMGSHGLDSLYDVAREYLVVNRHKSLQKFAVESLTYLSLNADCKERLILDSPVIKLLLEIGSETDDKATIYAVITVIENLTNSQEKAEASEEQEQLKKLKEYAKEYVPEDHPKDAPEFVMKRVELLISQGVSVALYDLAKIRPLIKLLSATHELRIFEALLALTNLTSMGENVQKRFIACDGVTKVTDLQMDENPLIQRAATECMCNMIGYDEVYDMYVTPGSSRYNDLKMWILLSDSDDVACSKAASGGLCMLSSDSRICDRIVAEEFGLEIIHKLCLHPDSDLQMRGLYILHNILKDSK